MEKVLHESLLNALMNDKLTLQELQLPDADSITNFIADTKTKWFELGFKSAVQLVQNGTLKLE